MKKKLKVDEVLLSGDDEALMEYAYDTEKCVVVDWREDDEEIVASVAEFIRKAELTAEMTEDEPPVLIVSYKGEETPIALTESPADRYVVLRGLNVVLEGDYELRVFNLTLETDTHGFLVKSTAWWKAMDEREPERMEEVFSKLTDAIDFS